MEKKSLNFLKELIYYKRSDEKKNAVGMKPIHLLKENFLWPSQLGLQNTLTASLKRGKTPSPSNECPGYDAKQSDNES